MKKELSFIIDKGNSTSTQHTSGNAELEKEKQRLFDKIDGTRTSRPSLSQLKLIQRKLMQRYPNVFQMAKIITPKRGRAADDVARKWFSHAVVQRHIHAIPMNMVLTFALNCM